MQYRMRTYGPILIALALLHASVSLGMYGLSVIGWFPHLHNGKGVWYFAGDSQPYEDEVIQLANQLSTGGGAWWHAEVPAHTRPYSIAYYLLGPSRLSTIPIKTLIYLLTVGMVFVVGRTWGHRTGVGAAAIVALWPSYLLHSTTLLKDPLFIPAELLFFYGLIRLVEPTEGWREAVLLTGTAIMGFVAARSVRRYIGEMNLFLWAIGFGYLTVRLWRQTGLWSKWTTGAVALVLFGMLESQPIIAEIAEIALTLTTQPTTHAQITVPENPVTPSEGDHRGTETTGSTEPVRPPASSPEPQPVKPAPAAPAPRIGPSVPPLLDAIERAVRERINRTRAGYIQDHPHSGSQIDTNVTFETPNELLAYLPRAAAIGFFTPFSRMWFVPGRETGRIGRSIAGIETSVMYIATLFMTLCLWQERRRPSMWFLALFVTTGVTLLGLVIPNVGAIFRMRYVFWFVMLIPAVHATIKLTHDQGALALAWQAVLKHLVLHSAH